MMQRKKTRNNKLNRAQNEKLKKKKTLEKNYGHRFFRGFGGFGSMLNFFLNLPFLYIMERELNYVFNINRRLNLHLLTPEAHMRYM